MSNPSLFPPGCLENIAKLGGTPCPDEVCGQLWEGQYARVICNCEPPYENGCAGPNPPPDCCHFSPSSPLPSYTNEGLCYCCCGGLARRPQVAVGRDEQKPIDELRRGDQVMTALDVGLTAWAVRPIAFSAGTGPNPDNPLIEISFGDGRVPDTILASRNQLFLVEGRVLKRAARLRPGDNLIRADGSTASVLALQAARAHRGAHQIATGTEPTSEVAGHLIVVNSVVCGDYALQLAELETTRPQLLAHDHMDERGY